MLTDQISASISTASRSEGSSAGAMGSGRSCSSGASHFGREMGTETKVACLTYHALREHGDQYSIKLDQLRAQLAFLQSRGYCVEGFEQLEARLRSGHAFPRDCVLLTVDDGRESSMQMADVFAQHNFGATFFVTRDRCLKKMGYIREAEIRELRKLGFSLGTHGTTHGKLTFMTEQRCLEELKGSKDWLEDVLGERVFYMSVPGGYINSRVRRLAQSCGYLLTGTCREWMNSSKDLRLPGDVNRVNVRRHFSIRDFRDIVTARMSFYLWRQVRAAALAIPKQLLR